MRPLNQKRYLVIQMLNEVKMDCYWLMRKRMALQRVQTKWLHCLRQLDQWHQLQKDGERWGVENVGASRKAGPEGRHLWLESKMRVGSAWGLRGNMGVFCVNTRTRSTVS